MVRLNFRKSPPTSSQHAKARPTVRLSTSPGVLSLGVTSNGGPTDRPRLLEHLNGSAIAGADANSVTRNRPRIGFILQDSRLLGPPTKRAFSCVLQCTLYLATWRVTPGG